MHARQSVAVLAALTVMIAGQQALAQDERYQLERTDDGYVRLDTQSGEMSICRERGPRLVCRAATMAGDREDGGAAALARRIDALETRVMALEQGAVSGSGLPDEEEFERSLGYMERFFRRFMGIARDLDRDLGEEPAPDRT